MRTKLTLLSLLAIVLLPLSSSSQLPTLIGHQDLLGYYNPATISGSKGQISYLYRYQWENIGPTSNTLYLKFPKMTKKGGFNSLGGILKYDDFDIINETQAEVFFAKNIFSIGSLNVRLGLNVGMNYRGIITDNLSIEEAIDPNLSQIDKSLFMTSKAGINLNHKLFDLGFATRFIDAKSITDFYSSFIFKVPLPKSKFKINTLVTHRLTESYKSQLEGQLRINYNNRVTLGGGYRENYGTIIQIGFWLKQKIKVSYGVETLESSNSSLGLTHEILGSYHFESPALLEQIEDSIAKAISDSLKEERLKKYEEKKKEEARQDSIANALDEENGLNDERLLADEELTNNPFGDTASSSMDGTIFSNEKVEDPSNNNFGNEQDGIYSSISQIDNELNGGGQNQSLGISENIDGSYVAFEDFSGDLASGEVHAILTRIAFEPGLYLLTPGSFIELERLYKYVNNNPLVHLDIQGHTDDVGSESSNLALSRYRALAVYNFLLSQGINKNRMNTVGFGESKPLVPNTNSKNRSINRRIEIILKEF